MATLARVQIIPPYVGELRTRTGYYIGWVPNEFANQIEADNAYSILKNDTSIAHALHLHCCMAAGEKWKIEADDERLQRIVTNMVSRIRDFSHARKSLLDGGILFGLGVQRKYYEKYEDPDFPGVELIGVSEIQEVDRRRLRIERDQDDKSEQYWTIYCPKIDQYIVLEDRSVNPYAQEGSGVQDYIWYFHEREELNPYFRGMGEVLYQIAYIKSKVMQYWADLCESWSKPWIIGAIDSAKAAISAAIGGDVKSYSKAAEELLTIFENCRARHSIVLDKSHDVTFYEHGSAGLNILSQFMEYANNEIRLLLLGAELTTSAGGGGGSYALGSVHRQQTETLIMYSRLRLQEFLEHDLLMDFIERNGMALYRLGFPPIQKKDLKFRVYVEMEEERKKIMDKKMEGSRADMEKML